MSLRLERLLAMDAAIRSGSYPGVATFMRRFEVSERTVRADLAFMRERLSAPLSHDRARSGYYYTDPNWALPTLRATEGERRILKLVGNSSETAVYLQGGVVE